MTLDFFKHKYGYEVEGIWFPRVTAITSLISRPFGYGIQSYADWGILVHETIEGILKGRNAEVESRIIPSIAAFEQWVKEHNMKVENPALDIEARVCDGDTGYAGTVDIIAEIDGKKGILDVKTSNGMREEYLLQTAAYMRAYNKTAKKKKEAITRWILRIEQFEECKGCFARKYSRDKKARVQDGKLSCNHQWAPARGEVEFVELDDYEKDIQAFLAAKEVWEWYYRNLLKKILNYAKNDSQKVLI